MAFKQFHTPPVIHIDIYFFHQRSVYIPHFVCPVAVGCKRVGNINGHKILHEYAIRNSVLTSIIAFYIKGSTGTAVSIDNINPGANTQYYVNNNGGGTIQYDGFTSPLTASAAVVQCQTYHLKLAIADAGDCQYSSAVFLANKGITCPASQVPQLATTSTPLNCGNDGTATVNVTNGQGTISYNWQPGGQTTATATNLAAGTYTCTVGYTLPCPYTQTITAIKRRAGGC